MKISLKGRVLKNVAKIKVIMPRDPILAIVSLIAAIAMWAWVTKNIVPL